jgi:hypothetical protein
VGGDPLLNVYFLEWGAHQLTQGLPDPWSPPFFYPTPRVLTLSDHLLGPAVAFAALRGIGLSSLGAYNVLLLASFVVGGWVAWWVLRGSGLSWAGAFLGGWFFAFAGYRWSSIGHYQVVRMQWIPAVLYTFDRLLERPAPGRAVAFLVFYVLHVSGGAYLAALIHVSLAVLLANRLLEKQLNIFDMASLRVWLPTCVGAVALLATIYLPYRNTSVHLAARHSLDEMRVHGATLASFVTPSRFGLDGWLLSFLPSDSGRGDLFPGMAGLVLIGVALIRTRQPCPSSASRGALGGAALAVAGLALALGGLLLGDRATLSPGGSRTGEWLAGYAVPFLCAVTGLVAAAVGLRRTRAGMIFPGDTWGRGLVASGLAMLFLCLPTFFAVAWSLVPGMRAMRVPTRAFALALFPLAFLVAMGWDHLAALARKGPAWRGLLAVALVALLVESLPRFPAWQPVPDASQFPEYTRWIATHPEVHAYLELPLGNRPDWETGPMYLQTAHWRPLVNGYSAVLPPAFLEVAGVCQPFPDLSGLERLSDLGVSHVVVRRRTPSWQPGGSRARALSFLPLFEEALRERGARRVFSDADTDVYDIRESQPGGAPS